MPTDPIESPEDFADRQWAWLDREKMREAVRARDAAVRREAIEDAIAAAVATRRACRLFGNPTRPIDLALDNIRDLLKRGRLR